MPADALLAVLAETLWIWGIYAAGLLLERLRPAGPHADLRTLAHNLLHVPVYLLLVTLLATPMHAAVSPWLAHAWRPFAPPQAAAAKIAAAGAWFAVLDFFYYWFHRAMHAHPRLWHVHALHHSDAALGVTATLRVHWLESPLRLVAITLPMGMLLDFPPPDLGRAGAVMMLWLFWLHLNLRLPLGLLTGWVAGPQWHRLHHSREHRHRDCNFALYLPLWDRLFGTYVAPGRGEYPATGVERGESIGWRDWLVPRRLIRRGAPRRR